LTLDLSTGTLNDWMESMEGHMPATFYTAMQWRECARRTRATVDQLVDPSARRTMASIAAAYEKLATQAESREEKPWGSKKTNA
jgi:hypothetical protein